MGYREFLLRRIAKSCQRTVSFLREHTLLESLMVAATAGTGFFQGEFLPKLLNSAVWGFVTLGIIIVGVFIYQYIMAPVHLIAEQQALIIAQNDLATPRLEIIFSGGNAPFEDSDKHMKQFCVGVKNTDSRITVDNVSLRLERIQPNGTIPLLEFREMIFPFIEVYRRYSNADSNLRNIKPNRLITLNPMETRYFEIAFMYQGMKENHIELCFFPTNYLIPARKHTLGIRASGKNVTSQYAEFSVDVTNDGQLLFASA